MKKGAEGNIAEITIVEYEKIVTAARRMAYDDVKNAYPKSLEIELRASSTYLNLVRFYISNMVDMYHTHVQLSVAVKAGCNCGCGEKSE